MVLTCLEGSLEAFEWSMGGMPDMIKLQREENCNLLNNIVIYQKAKTVVCLEGKGIELVLAVRTVDEGHDLASVQPRIVLGLGLKLDDGPIIQESTLPALVMEKIVKGDELTVEAGICEEDCKGRRPGS
ncbi:hypothetical protein VNO78_02923 [Psophocarpus tetragonolobus]|uniref:Uncharacterized protein n=1 Tax=Psophocarpus tetragonolobus TaxID=3891 RepID=A0AAN9T256_PSOTE